ncbi:WD40 repeat domain-containing protein [Nocardia goodfellowii]|uniref:WD40 repeat protein n=1 Tax=Nocardia goodfellowii TaxID=882446 RepID=A0ABS4QMQ2_9NOCA|nr:WD40 repeat domain-containing protein [Nocardia goodfellowii]MBP2192979.1 WD40 repeat protein [Nocardia goodfellowii]
MNPMVLCTVDHAAAAVAFTPDGARILSTGPDGTARLSDIATGAELTRFTAPVPLAQPAISPNGARIAVNGVLSQGEFGEDSVYTTFVFDSASGSKRWDVSHPQVAFVTDQVLFPAGGTTLFQAAMYSAATLFTAADGAVRWKLPLTRPDPLTCVAIDVDRALIACGSGDMFAFEPDTPGRVRLLEAATGTVRWSVAVAHPVVGIDLHAGAGVLALCRNDNSTALLSLATGARLRELGPAHQEFTVLGCSVRIAPDGRTVLTQDAVNIDTVYSVSSGNKLWAWAFPDPDAFPTPPSYSPDSRWILLPGETLTAVRVVAATTGATRCVLPHPAAVRSAEFDSTGARVVTGCADGKVRVWRLPPAERLRLAQAGAVTGIVFDSAGTTLAVAATDKTVRGFAVADGAPRARLDHGGPVRVLCAVPGQPWIATGSDDGTVRILDLGTGGERLRLGHDGPVRAVAADHSGTRLATGSDDFTARVIDTATGAQVRAHQFNGEVTAVAFHPDGTRLAAASTEGVVRLFATTSGAPLLTMQPGSAVTAVAFHPDGLRLATAQADNTVRVFDATNGSQRFSIAVDAAVNALAFSPDGTRIVIVSADRTARIHDSTNGALVHTLTHPAPVTAVAYRADGAAIATSAGTFVTQWDSSTGDRIVEFGHDGAVTALAYQPLDRALATATATAVLLWDAP